MKTSFSTIRNRKPQFPKYVLHAFLFLLIGVSVFAYLANDDDTKVSAESPQNEIEKAIFRREEFFGAEAFVPLPTAEAREALAKLAETQPGNPQLLEKLAELNEKLERFDEAEKNLVHLREIDAAKSEPLAAFYHRRANFEKEAAVLKENLFAKETKNRVAVFERLVDLARLHDLREYLQPVFYAQITKEMPNASGIFQKIAEKLSEEKNYAEALKFVRQAKAQFPAQKNIWLDKEIEILAAMNKTDEAVTVYRAAFDPFWSESDAQKFYDFLNEQNRLREYGAELKAEFKKNPANFDAGIRLALYQNHDYVYSNDDITPIILQIESAKKDWTTDALITATRLLLQNAKGNLASKFLYTLYLREDFRKSPAQRGKILYQLFKIFSDADYQELPLTKGDLRFYEDVAKADTNPGISTGILSLIFSDTKPLQKLESQETQANKYFNRAAAYRIFEEYKKDSPVSDELAQMYLDIVRIYTQAKEPAVAEKTLNEFAARYENSRYFPAAAVKLAEAFSETEQEEKARQVYQKALDYLGKQGKISAPQNSENKTAEEEDEPENETADGDESSSKLVFYDAFADKKVSVTYREILAKYVASLAKENKTPQILALYSNEIANYPAQEWLYEERLSWLEQTNLTQETLESYKLALARFKTNDWRDKLARFFVRKKRNAEFKALSEDLVGTLNDEEIRQYLAEFIDRNASEKDFRRALYFKLYQLAHRRFPHNVSFVNGLLSYYKANNLDADWRKLSAEYYFESKEIRESFLSDLAAKSELRNYLQTAQTKQNTIYELFRADASARLSNFENSVAAYRKLNRLYPHTPEFSERLVAFTRSFGQENRTILTESSEIAKSQADYILSSAEYRTRSGEIFAELGNYEKSREEWEKLIATARGSREIYLDTATVYWDYFQFDDALRTIESLRRKFADETLYAYEAGAILESQGKEKEAVGEYVRALDANDDDDQKMKAQKRLTKLAGVKDSAKQQNVLPVIAAAYSNEASCRKDSSFLALAYAEFLVKIKQTSKAEALLNQAINRSDNKDFLNAAHSFYQTESNLAGEQTALKRLAEISANPRQKIQFQLQLAASFEEDRKRDAAKNILENLILKFPTNYGVLTETVAFYKRLGFEADAVSVLKIALPQSKGIYRTELAQKLAGFLVQTNQLDSAERILSDLHAENKENTAILRELANVCVRTGNVELLRQSFAETIAALKQSSTPRTELDDRIAELRVSMIDAFTRLKDYHSAIKQHIEIINRDPDDERLTENAIRYVQRYGGAEMLIAYYQKLSTEAFKNYRWNVVLARIYEAGNDAENAVKNYRAAIVNQPEMVELYLAIADIETKRGNYDAALKNFETILELTNDDAFYVKKKIEVLKKAGRTAEVAAETAKLPAEQEKKIVENAFSEARRLLNFENTKAREIYRQAFAKLSENPLRESLNAADISGYVYSVREEEPLNLIYERLWNLREKLAAIAVAENSIDAGEARKRLAILDGAMTESIGNIAKTSGTDEEISAIHADLKTRIERTPMANDQYQTISLAQNISVRAGFGDLEELVLRKKVETSSSASDKKYNLLNLVSFYNERGAYRQTFDALEKYSGDDFSLKAETAQLIGDREKELEFLRQIYRKSFDKLSVTNDPYVARYLEILYAENKNELASLTETNSAFQLQLINFLLAKGEPSLVHKAIGSANLSAAWKLARSAETSLALREFDENINCFFCDALQFDSIGKMVSRPPDKQQVLINDDWFRLTREYGEWLYEKNEKAVSPDKFLPALTENFPNSGAEQNKLGVFYMQKKEYEKALARFLLASEFSPEDNEVKTNLSAAYFLAGKKDAAEKIWSELFQNQPPGDELKNSLKSTQTLQEYGLVEHVRGKLSPVIVKFLENNDADTSGDFRELIRIIAKSFKDEPTKSAFFLQVLKNRPTDKSLAEMLIDDGLIAKNLQSDFYRLIIERSSPETYPDYELQAVRQRVFSEEEAEFVYEAETGFNTKEPENERLKWQKKYLEYLLEQRETSEINRLIAEIETDLKNRYARPFWLRKAQITAKIRAGKFDLAEAERAIGIIAPESAAETNAPNLERFNEILSVLKAEKRTAEASKLAEDFFARDLALEEFETANFAGLARVYFQRNETEKALRILRLMIDAGNENTRQTAFAELFTLEIIKAELPNAVKTTKNERGNAFSQSEALKVSAEIAAEFGQVNPAIDFRQTLVSANPDDSANKIELAKLLAANNRRGEAVALLNEIIRDKNALRAMRWEARFKLRETGENLEFPNISFDPYSQFYNGLTAAKSNQPEAAKEFFINSLIADYEAQTSARQELIKIYALSGQPFAALKTAEKFNGAKSDELLRILSEAAEKTGDFRRAIDFEKARTNGRSGERIAVLEKLLAEKNKRATDLTVDTENTRNL